VDVTAEPVDGASDLDRLLTGLQPEESAAHDVEGELQRLDGDVEGPTLTLDLAPALEHGLGLPAHRGGEAGDALAVKERLGNAALPLPEVAVAGEEAAPQHGLEGLDEAPVLDVASGIVDQHVADEVGMVDEQQLDGAKAQRDEVAKRGGAHEQLQ